jgi:hypothetical protein
MMMSHNNLETTLKVSLPEIPIPIHESFHESYNSEDHRVVMKTLLWYLWDWKGQMISRLKFCIYHSPSE